MCKIADEKKCSASDSFAPKLPTRGCASGLHWGHSPQTPDPPPPTIPRSATGHSCSIQADILTVSGHVSQQTVELEPTRSLTPVSASLYS